MLDCLMIWSVHSLKLNFSVVHNTSCQFGFFPINHFSSVFQGVEKRMVTSENISFDIGREKDHGTDYWCISGLSFTAGTWLPGTRHWWFYVLVVLMNMAVMIHHIDIKIIHSSCEIEDFVENFFASCV